MPTESEKLGIEAQALGVSVVLGPGVNMKRSPLCGRNFNASPKTRCSLGRSRLLDGRRNQSVGVGASVKRCGQQSGDRPHDGLGRNRRTRCVKLFPGVRASGHPSQPWTVMCSYNRINGVYASQDPWLLTTVLRDEWGFEGLVVSDWGAVDSRPAAVAAGLDLEMPSSVGSGAQKVLDALASLGNLRRRR
ncbi:MAG: glycoside hydrolase family 3 N-terminal domain-containing protein [Acidimicrobiales bacterium]